MSLFPQTELDIHHIQAIVRAMHELALTDGMHDAERVMLRGFYDSCQPLTTRGIWRQHGVNDENR